METKSYSDINYQAFMEAAWKNHYFLCETKGRNEIEVDKKNKLHERIPSKTKIH